MRSKLISNACRNRLPMYLDYLKSLAINDCAFISSTTIAKSLGLGEVQVRKDLSAVCGVGRPKVGDNIHTLKDSIEGYLKFNRNDKVIIVGAEKLGKALLDYDGFEAVTANRNVCIKNVNIAALLALISKNAY